MWLHTHPWSTLFWHCLHRRSMSASRIGRCSSSTSLSADNRRSSPSSTNTCFTRRSFSSLIMLSINKHFWKYFNHHISLQSIRHHVISRLPLAKGPESKKQRHTQSCKSNLYFGFIRPIFAPSWAMQVGTIRPVGTPTQRCLQYSTALVSAKRN